MEKLNEAQEYPEGHHTIVRLSQTSKRGRGSGIADQVTQYNAGIWNGHLFVC